MIRTQAQLASIEDEFVGRVRAMIGAGLSIKAIKLEPCV